MVKLPLFISGFRLKKAWLQAELEVTSTNGEVQFIKAPEILLMLFPQIH